SEEIERARATARKWAVYGGLAGGVVGGIIAFIAGGSKEAGDRQKAAARGAGLLEKDVKAAVAKMKELDDKLAEAATKIRHKQFPDNVATELGAINVPFDTTNLDGKQVGSLPAKVLKSLLAFTSGVADVNKSKDSLRNVLTLAQAPAVKAWKEEKEPMANFSI